MCPKEKLFTIKMPGFKLLLIHNSYSCIDFFSWKSRMMMPGGLYLLHLFKKNLSLANNQNTEQEAFS